jgi:hypothetical protein
MNYLFLIWAFPLSRFTKPKHRVGDFVLHSVTVFCPPKKADKRTGFFGKEKTIRQPPNAGKMTRKTKNFIYSIPII